MGSNFGCIRTGVFLMHFCLWFRPCELTTTSSVLSLVSAFMRGGVAFMRVGTTSHKGNYFKNSERRYRNYLAEINLTFGVENNT